MKDTSDPAAIHSFDQRSENIQKSEKYYETQVCN